MFTILLSGIVSAQTFDFTCEVEEEMEMESTGPQRFVERYGAQFSGYYTLTIDEDENSLTFAVTNAAPGTFPLTVTMRWFDDDSLSFLSSGDYVAAVNSQGAHERNFDQQTYRNGDPNGQPATLLLKDGTYQTNNSEGSNYFWRAFFDIDDDTIDNIVVILFGGQRA